MLPIHYHHDTLSDERPSASEMSLFKDVGVANFLNDPVFGKSACAAVACSKIMTFLRHNCPNLTENDETRFRNQKYRASTKRTRDFLKLVDEFTEVCLASGCEAGHVSELVHQIVKFANEPTEGENEEPVYHAPKRPRKYRRNTVPNSNFASPLLPVISSVFRIPFCTQEHAEVNQYLGLGSKETSDRQTSTAFDLQHLAIALDPFVITMAGNRLNSDYLGNGCIRTVGREHSKSMIWAPPIRKRDSDVTIPRIYAAPMSEKPNLPYEKNSFTAIQLPDEFIGSNICELHTTSV